VGGLMFFGMLAATAWAVWRIPKANPGVPATILLLYVLLLSVTHTTYTTKMFWMPLILTLVVAEYGRREADGNLSAGQTPATPT
jgi:hypothetical protein